MSLVLRADSIGKSFDGRSVLSAASLRVRAGEIVFLAGRNGCGKSTLLRVSCGALRADYGTVSFKGKTYLAPRWHSLARLGLYYLPDREILDPGRTVRQHLQSIARQFQLDGSSEGVDSCQIESLLDRRCGELSTGERRRVEVATAVMRTPDCLLADEPFRHIDPVDKAVIGAAFRRLASAGCAVVVTGHDIEDLFDLADSIVWCTDGTTYEMGAPNAAVADWRFASTFVGDARAARIAADSAG